MRSILLIGPMSLDLLYVKCFTDTASVPSFQNVVANSDSAVAEDYQ